MIHATRRFALALLSIALLHSATTAQDTAPKTFPPKGWKAGNADELMASSMSSYSQKVGLQIQHFQTTAEWPVAVVTDGEGNVVAHGKAGSQLTLTGLDIGRSYRVYFSQPKNRRYTLHDEDFINCQERTFPNKTWKAQKRALLPLKSVKQNSPKNMADMLFKKVRHEICFKTAKTEQPCLYVMCHVQKDGKHKVVSQSLTPAINFWSAAKAGDAVHIYQLFPHDRTFRKSKVFKVDQDSPWGK